MSNLKTQNEALADLILGILIFGILVVFVGLFVAPDKAAFVLGAVLGTATSVQVCVYQNFWQRKVKLWAMKSTLWYMDMFL